MNTLVYSNFVTYASIYFMMRSIYKIFESNFIISFRRFALLSNIAKAEQDVRLTIKTKISRRI